MNLFNYDGHMAVDKQTYEAIKEIINLTYDEFMMIPDIERNEWIDACRLALLLIEEKRELLYEGYRNTNMFDLNGNFNLGEATCIIREKKKVLDIIEKDTDIELTPAQFILLGEKGTQEIMNKGIKIINQETSNALSEGKVNKHVQTRNEMEKLELDVDEIL